MLVDVASVDELAEGVPKVVPLVGRREVVLVQWRDRVFALKNVCPHQTQSFAGGIVATRIQSVGTPGQIQMRQDRPLLACPWHRWEFELESGICSLDPTIRVRTYRTTIESGRVLVEVGPA